MTTRRCWASRGIRAQRAGAPTATAALQDELEQLVLDLTSRIEELDEELAAAREANRGLMAELNRQ
jgi:hypothetical protein